MIEDNDAKPHHASIWRISLTIVCLGLFTYGLIYAEPSTESLLIFAGKKFPLAMIIWLFFYIPVSRNNKENVTLLSFLAIYISLLTPEVIRPFLVIAT